MIVSCDCCILIVLVLKLFRCRLHILVSSCCLSSVVLGYPCFWNFNSVIPIVVRVDSYVNSPLNWFILRLRKVIGLFGHKREASFTCAKTHFFDTLNTTHEWQDFIIIQLSLIYCTSSVLRDIFY